MQANADLFEIAKKIRANEALAYVVIVTPAKFLMAALEERDDASEVLADIHAYLAAYGHQGYSMDFVEPTQVEDPSALFASLKPMVQDPDYDPKQQEERAANVRVEKHAEIRKLLHGLEYWQFRYRWWLARRYNYIREEVAFHFGYTWSVLRPMVAELGQRMVEAGTFRQPDDAYFLVTEELKRAIEARRDGRGTAGTRRACRRTARTARGTQAAPSAGHDSRRGAGQPGRVVQGDADTERRVERHVARLSGQLGTRYGSRQRGAWRGRLRQDGARLHPRKPPDDPPRGRNCSRMPSDS